MKDKNYLVQIDLIKCFAIISVIILHTRKPYPKYIFYFWQAVPIFTVFLGFNAGLSFIKKDYNKLSDLYSVSYFKSRFERIVFPVILIFIISSVLSYIQNYNLSFRPLNLIGYLPFSGPGNYFITIVLSFILVFPLLYRLFLYNPTVMLITAFAVDIIFQLLAPYIFSKNPYLYNSSVFRYLSAIALGLWLVKDYRIYSKRNAFIIIGAIGSTIYLYNYSFKSYQFPLFHSMVSFQNILSFFYTAFIILLFLNLPIKNWIIFKPFAFIGRLSYHIFLVQILYFSVIQKFDFINQYYVRIPTYQYKRYINILVCLVIGIIFYYLDASIRLLWNKLKA